MARSGSHERDQLLSKLPYAGDAAFNSRFSEEHDRLCLPNTRVDLLEKIITWSNNPDDAYIFWLNGMAGTGKTTIARTIAQTCDGLKRLGASFFFSTGHNDLNHATKFFTTIAVQLATNIPDLQESICNAIKKNHNIAHLSLAEQWKKLILQPLTNLRDHREQITLVIDALDECKGEKDIRLILRLFSESAILRAAKLRIFVTSRPETPVRLGFNHIHQAAHQDFILHNIPQSLIQHDMMVYFQTELENIRSYFSLPKDWPGKDNLDLLVRKADKLIIIAATICRFIRHSIDPRQHLSFALQGYTARLSPTKELDAMYTKVLIRFVIGNFEEELSERFRQIVGSIILLSDPLSSEALAKLLNMDEYTVKYTVNSLRSVLDVSESQDCRIQLLHPSFRDFLLDPQRCFERQFWIIEDQTHRDLFVSCITLMSNHLKRDLCNLQLPGALSCEVEYSVVEKSIPLAVNYACRYWVHHLRLSNVKLSDNSLVHSFLRQHFLHWLEALSLIRKMSDSVLIIRSLESIPTLNSDTTHDLRLMVYDAKRFILNNRSMIETAPLQLYCSALVFSPRTSVIGCHFRDQIPPWIKNTPVVPDVWDPILQSLEGHSSDILAVAFSPDGKCLASSSQDDTVRLWDPLTGSSQGTIEGLSCVFALAFSPDRPLLACACYDNTVRLCDPLTGALRVTLEGHSAPVFGVKFSWDGKLLASASDDRTVRLWDPSTGVTRGSLEGHPAGVKAVAFSPDGNLLASASEDGTVRLWDLSSGATLRIFKGGHSNSTWDVAFSPDGRLLACDCFDEVWLWDTSTGALHAILDHHSHPVLGVAFAPYCQLLASACMDGTVKLWNPSTGAACGTLQCHSSVVGVAFSPDGQLIASASDTAVKLLDPSTVTSSGSVDGNSFIRVMAFSSNGQILASASGDHTVKLWNPSTGATCGTLEGHLEPVWAVAFSPDDQLLASASADHTIRLWDLSRRVTCDTLECNPFQIFNVAFSPDGQLLSAEVDDDTVMLWYPPRIDSLVALEGHSSEIGAISFSPDGNLLASASSDNTVRIWDIKTKQTVQVLSTERQIHTLYFPSDGSYLQTSEGILELERVTHGECRSQSDSSSYLLRASGQWVMWGVENILWLPHDYRPTYLSVRHNILAIGHASGRVTFLEFDPNTIPLGEFVVSNYQQKV